MADIFTQMKEDGLFQVLESHQDFNNFSNLPKNPIGQINLIVEDGISSSYSSASLRWVNEVKAIFDRSGLPWEFIEGLNSPKYLSRMRVKDDYKNSFSNDHRPHPIIDLDILLGFSEAIRLEFRWDRTQNTQALVLDVDDLPAPKQQRVNQFVNFEVGKVFTFDSTDSGSKHQICTKELFCFCVDFISESYNQKHREILRFTKNIILVHGIRTTAKWQTVIKVHLESLGFKVDCSNYGIYDLVHFLIPFKFFKRPAINKVKQDINISTSKGDNRFTNYLVGHSFGSWLIVESLDHLLNEFKTIIFCGSIARAEDGSKLLDRSNSVLNEIGDKDLMPALARSIKRVYGYGSVGSSGFRGSSLITDRHHPNLGHSDFLNIEFVNEFWLPIFDDNSPSSRPASKGEVNHRSKLFELFKNFIELIPLEIIIMIFIFIVFTLLS